MKKRVVFPKGKQKEFLIKSRGTLKITWSEFADKLNIKCKNLEKNYRYEYSNLPYNIYKKICELCNLSEKELEKYYGLEKKMLGSIITKKVYGKSRAKLPKLNIKFKSRIPYFDTKNIKFSCFDKIKKIKLPERLTPELAEEIGMHLGDGFLSSKKFEYRLKGNKNEKGYYDNSIKRLYKNLYNLDLDMKEYESTYGFELCSQAIWNFKNKILKIPSGRKDNIKIPELIKVEDTEILTSFLRGMFDTDGCVSFIKKYTKFGNYYPVISISLKSKELIFDIAEILEMLGLKPKISFWEYWTISLNGYERLEKYSKLIGWSNPKNIDKVIKWKKQYPKLGKEVYTWR